MLQIRSLQKKNPIFQIGRNFKARDFQDSNAKGF